MYFVDREKMNAILAYMESCLQTLQNHRAWKNRMDLLALERLAHVLIESVIDVGNQMIDGFIMRDPGSYEDIVDILYDEKVVSERDCHALKAIIAERSVLVRTYTMVDHDVLLKLLDDCMPALQAFPSAIRRYLDEELGPLSAFLHNEENRS